MDEKKESFKHVSVDYPTDYSTHTKFVLFDYDMFDKWLGRLEDAHEREVREHTLEYDIDGLSDRELAEHGLVRMAVDADGEVIHIGDVMDTEHFGTVEVEGFVHSAVAFYNYSGQPAYICTAPANTCHHHEPTVEDVLWEFTDEVWNRCCEGATASDSGIDGLVAECAAKLRLAGENE